MSSSSSTKRSRMMTKQVCKPTLGSVRVARETESPHWSGVPFRSGWRRLERRWSTWTLLYLIVGEYADFILIPRRCYRRSIKPRIADHVVELRPELGQKYDMGTAKHTPGEPGYAQFAPDSNQPARPKICRRYWLSRVREQNELLRI